MSSGSLFFATSPNDLVIDAEILVRQNVAKARYRAPFDLRMLRANLGRNSLCSFPEDEQVVEHSVSRPSVAPELGELSELCDLSVSGAGGNQHIAQSQPVVTQRELPRSLRRDASRRAALAA
jgi:hypothetical protein